MRVEPPAVGSGVGDDEPLADGQRIPPALAGDLGSEPPLPVCRAEQLVDVGDGGLELDDKEGPGRLMPGEDVDHAALPVDREGDLGGEHPLGELGREPPRDQLVQLGVAGVEQPIQVAGAPPGIDVDPDVKGRRHAPDVVQSHRADVPTLHPAHAWPATPWPCWRDHPATSPSAAEPIAAPLRSAGLPCRGVSQAGLAWQLMATYSRLD